MDRKIDQALRLIRGGGRLSLDQSMDMATSCSVDDLVAGANSLREEYHNDKIDLCSIVNAASGSCSEDCRFCAQSAHHSVGIDHYYAVEPSFALKLAKINDAHGVQRFSFVTAGRSIVPRRIKALAPIIDSVKADTDMELCASMGLLTKERAEELVSLGITRYHCNLEASRSYFPKICTTHTWDDKVETIRIAKEAGMEVCSGGIIGLGESLRQRLELACELRDLEIRSIPINVLNPIPNTPFSDLQPLSKDEVFQAIAMFRFINPDAVIRMAGGRALLGDAQEQCFTSGANGAIVGDYLTTTGTTLKRDLEMFSRLGFDLKNKVGTKEGGNGATA